MQKHLLQVMVALYKSEINCSISSFWDDGFTVKIGDDMNGFAAEKNFRPNEFDRAASWLDRKAKELYPDSVFAKAA